jgi:hypothetical protein
LNERNREAADDWMREHHLPDPERFSLEDNEEHGDAQLNVFLRYRDSATVVYKVAVKDGKGSSVLKEVYHGEGTKATTARGVPRARPERRGPRKGAEGSVLPSSAKASDALQWHHESGTPLRGR